MSGRAGVVFRLTSWVPLATFVTAQLYLDRFEGWGRWAAAPMLLVPVALSSAFVGWGVLMLRREQGAGSTSAATWLALALASVPFLWLVWRLIVTA
jgi:hypothetical protein